jgi:hypothetical protein
LWLWPTILITVAFAGFSYISPIKPQSLYVDNHFHLTRSADQLIFQTNYVVERFSLDDGYQNFLFLFELYNYASVAQSLFENLDEYAECLDIIKDRVLKIIWSFHTKSLGNKGSGGGDETRGGCGGSGGTITPIPMTVHHVTRVQTRGRPGSNPGP